MSVPSLSWQNDAFYIKMAQKSRFLQEFSYLTGAIRSMIEALDSPEPTAAQVTKQNGGGSTFWRKRSFCQDRLGTNRRKNSPKRSGFWQLSISGADVRACLEVSTAAHQSAIGGSVPVQLPLTDRVSSPLYPRPYRWIGGDARPPLPSGELGDATPQPAEEVRAAEISGHGPPRPKL